uniref:Pyruvate dehydrogenase E1 component subunit beta n=1 Tax=Strombidium rassoulzadegani TaxID=1082188 RepID=A0A7S3FX07_9SPIT
MLTRNLRSALAAPRSMVRARAAGFHSSQPLNEVITVRDSLRIAMCDEMRRDQNVFLMGEEVGVYNGAYKVSKGMHEEFGEKRVVDTPITEAGFTGIGVGAGLVGLRPIVEFMTMNFALQSIDHIINSCAKAHYMSNGDLTCPIVFRGINGVSAGVAAQHSQCFAAWFASCPGLKVVSPWSAEDNLGLLRASIRDNDPVIFLENEMMYGVEFDVPQDQMDPNFVLPIGKAKVERQGVDVTITAHAKMVGFSLQAAELLKKEHDIDCEVINLRTIRPLDRPSIIESVKKTNRIVNVEEGWPQHGVGSEIAALLMESEAFDYLDAPMERVAGADVPMPYSVSIEQLAVPKVDDIVKAVLKACYRNKK